MKRPKNYITLPGFMTIPQAAGKMATELKGEYTPNDVNYFYRLVKNEIERGSLKSEVIGTSGRVKQVKIIDVDNMILKYKGGYESKEAEPRKTIDGSEITIKEEIISVIQLNKKGRINSEQALNIIKDIVNS